MSKHLFLTGLAAGAALMGAGYLGRRNLARTQRLTGIIPIVTPYIDIETAEGVLAVMERLPEERVTIVLHTLGGCVTACVLIANALRQFRDSTAIVPYMAISGGTLIALSARRLEMGDRASLSAVDPQIMGQRVKHLAEAKDKPSIAALAREYDVAMRKYVDAPCASTCPRTAWAPPWTCCSASMRRTSGRSSGPRSRPSGSRDARRPPVGRSGRPPGARGRAW
jgi:hypothetical protein